MIVRLLPHMPILCLGTPIHSSPKVLSLIRSVGSIVNEIHCGSSSTITRCIQLLIYSRWDFSHSLQNDQPHLCVRDDRTELFVRTVHICYPSLLSGHLWLCYLPTLPSRHLPFPSLFPMYPRPSGHLQYVFSPLPFAGVRCSGRDVIQCMVGWLVGWVSFAVGMARVQSPPYFAFLF